MAIIKNPLVVFSGSGGMDSTLLNFVRPKVTFSNQDFIDCDLANADMSKVNTLTNFFAARPNLTNIDLTHWNATTFTNITNIFGRDTLLTSIVGDATIEIVEANTLTVFNNLSLPIDVSTTGLQLPSLAALVNGLSTLSTPQSAMINFNLTQYNTLAAHTTNYIAAAKTKGWLVGRNGYSDETIAEETAGTIIGKRDGEIVFVKYSDFVDSSFVAEGFTPISVLVIPKSHTADGKCRGCSLVHMTSGTNVEAGSTATNASLIWGVLGVDTVLPNLDLVTTGNVPLDGTLGVTTNAYLPTDKLTDVASVIDTVGGLPVSNYGTSTPYIPSPYGANGIVNIQYRNGMAGNTRQANTDMNGFSNTATIIETYVEEYYPEVLVTGANLPNDLSRYPAFVACWRFLGGGYTDHSWYLPSCGEMGYYIVRWGAIDASLAAIISKYGNTVPAVRLQSGSWHWSSTEYSSLSSRYLLPSTGLVNNYYKNYSGCVRSFHAF